MNITRQHILAVLEQEPLDVVSRLALADAMEEDGEEESSSIERATAGVIQRNKNLATHVRHAVARANGRLRKWIICEQAAEQMVAEAIIGHQRRRLAGRLTSLVPRGLVTVRQVTGDDLAGNGSSNRGASCDDAPTAVVAVLVGPRNKVIVLGDTARGGAATLWPEVNDACHYGNGWLAWQYALRFMEEGRRHRENRRQP